MTTAAPGERAAGEPWPWTLLLALPVIGLLLLFVRPELDLHGSITRATSGWSS